MSKQSFGRPGEESCFTDLDAMDSPFLYKFPGRKGYTGSQLFKLIGKQVGQLNSSTPAAIFKHLCCLLTHMCHLEPFNKIGYGTTRKTTLTRKPKTIMIHRYADDIEVTKNTLKIAIEWLGFSNSFPAGNNTLGTHIYKMKVFAKVLMLCYLVMFMEIVRGVFGMYVDQGYEEYFYVKMNCEIILDNLFKSLVSAFTKFTIDMVTGNPNIANPRAKRKGDKNMEIMFNSFFKTHIEGKVIFKVSMLNVYRSVYYDFMKMSFKNYNKRQDDIEKKIDDSVQQLLKRVRLYDWSIEWAELLLCTDNVVNSPDGDDDYSDIRF